MDIGPPLEQGAIPMQHGCKDPMIRHARRRHLGADPVLQVDLDVVVDLDDDRHILLSIGLPSRTAQKP